MIRFYLSPSVTQSYHNLNSCKAVSWFGWLETNHKNKTKQIRKRENRECVGRRKKDLSKDRDRGKETKSVLSLSAGETWLSDNLIVALVCSLPQTASSCRVELCWPVGARDSTDYMPDSNITNNYCSQETAVRKHWGVGTKRRDSIYGYVILSVFYCLCRSTVHLVFLSLLSYLAVFIPDHESTLKSLKPKQWPDSQCVSPYSRYMGRAVNARQQMQWYTGNKRLKQSCCRVCYHLMTV